MINRIGCRMCVMLTGLLMLLPSGGIAGNSDFSAGTTFGRSNGNVTKAQMEKAGNNIGDYVPEFDKDKAESEYGSYYGGVKSSGRDMKAPGSEQFNTTEWGKAIQENKRKAPDMPGVSPGDDFLKQGQKAIDNAQSMFDPNLCKSVSFDKVVTVKKTCERDLEVSRVCTRTATIAGDWKETSEIRTFTLSAFTFSRKGKSIVFRVPTPETGDVIRANLRLDTEKTLWNSKVNFMNTQFNVAWSADVALTGATGMKLTKDEAITGEGCSGNGTCIGTLDDIIYKQLLNGSSRLTLTLIMKVGSRKWEPRVEWTENCPFSKSEDTLTSTVCTEPGGTKTVVVGGVTYPVTQACWRYEDTYRSQSATEGTCGALMNNSACTRIGVECSDSDEGICYSQKEIWQCQSPSTGKGQICGDELFCQDGSCVESQAQTNNHFAEAVSALATLAAAGEDARGDSMDIRVFTGKRQACRKSGLGFSNCCQSGGWGNSVGLAHCSDEEKALGKAREKDITIKVGTYCSKKVLGACLQKKTSYCVFDSKLAKIAQEQGRRGQLGIGFGGAKSPDCRGMTVEELSRLRFDKMDFSSFFEELSSQSNVPQDQQLLDRVNKSLKGFTGKFDPDTNQNPSTPIN